VNFHKQGAFVDDVKGFLMQCEAGAEVPKEVQDDLKKRKLLKTVSLLEFNVTKGAKFTTKRKKKVAVLTPEMLKSGEWAEVEFKPINLMARGPELVPGTRHPLMKVRTEIRQILLEMGFEEMPTNMFVESSFWNFDSLFQPQQHPARDAHDTFFLTAPAECKTLPAEYLTRVKEMHENGGHGSLGYRHDWDVREASKNILRTHTTAVSARMLYKLAQQKPFQPKRYFSIDRVFRNEAVDATHLAEFHQIEGLIADYDLSLGHLIGVIGAFFSRIGITGVEFKPAYNPYTEVGLPACECFSFSAHKSSFPPIYEAFDGDFRLFQGAEQVD